MATGLKESSDVPALRLNLVVHEEARFDGLADRIWPFLLEQNRWKKGVILEHERGPRRQRGEVFAAFLPDTTEPAYYVEAVEVRAPSRLTFKLFETVGGALMGFAAWVLREVGGETVMNYDVYGVYETRDAGPSGGLSAKETLEDDFARELSRRLTEEFSILRRLLKSDRDRHG